jgi:hypothetical protein
MGAQQRTYGVSQSSVDRTLRLTGLVVGLLDVAFLGLFALDVLSPSGSVLDQLAGLGIHLIPSAALALLIAFAWWFPAAGGTALIVASGLPFVTLTNPITANLILCLPVLATGSLFLVAGLLRMRRPVRDGNDA